MMSVAQTSPAQRVDNQQSRRDVVVITGASAGVGRATAHRFARAGARVGLIARDQAALDEVRAEIESMGGTAHGVAADVSDAAAVQEAAGELVRQFGPIDIWINDAMVTVFSPVSQISPDEFRRVTEVTYLGFVHGTMAALAHMRPRNRGTIVQVGSALAYRGIPLQAAYCGAKHAIRGFTSSLRTELIHDHSNIRVTVVDLPAVNTPQFDWARTHMPSQPRPVPPVVQPEVAADAIYRAAYGQRREYWLGLSTLEVILANALGPAFLDRYLARNAYSAQSTGAPVAGWRKDNLETPVHDLHRTRGSFGFQARNRAPVFPGPATRITVAALGLTLAGCFAFAAGRLIGNGRH
jgi:short-subunit dehydrogenase